MCAHECGPRLPIKLSSTIRRGVTLKLLTVDLEQVGLSADRIIVFVEHNDVYEARRRGHHESVGRSSRLGFNPLDGVGNHDLVPSSQQVGVGARAPQ